MPIKTKIYLFLSIFFVCILLYFLLPLLYPQNHIIHQYIFHEFDIFKNPSANFILVIVFFLLIAVGGTFLMEIIYRGITGKQFQHKKIGKYLISENLITERELKNALAEQNFKIGAVLLKYNRITSLQLNNALKVHKSTQQRLGDVLKALGYITDEDITWALKKLNRSLGDILKDHQSISDYDLQCVLSLQRYASYKD